MKKIVFGILSVFLLTGLSANGRLDQLNRLTSQESLQYTLEKKQDGKISVATVKNGKTEYWGFDCNGKISGAELNTSYLYEIGSLTKTITAALICKAKQEGRLKLEDGINQYLDLPQKDYYPTIKQLVTHTSGYKPFYMEKGMTGNHLSHKNDFYGITRKQILDRLAAVSIKEKDYEFEYSNFGYSVLGLILESVYQKSYTELVEDFVHNELGMKNTIIANGKGNLENYWDWNKDDAYLSAGGLYSTIEDMLIYAQWQLENGALAKETHSIMTAITANEPAYKAMGINTDGICYGWIKDMKNDWLWHNGATTNYNAYLAYSIKNQTAVVVLSNLSPKYRIPSTVTGCKLMKEISAD